MKSKITRSTKTSKMAVAGKQLRKNRISEVVYETAKGLYAAGAMSRTTMREFDTLCLPKIPKYSSRQIRAIRDRCNASQKIFAAYMNISPSSLQKWETGARKPDGVALKLLNLVDKKGLQALI